MVFRTYTALFFFHFDIPFTRLTYNLDFKKVRESDTSLKLLYPNRVYTDFSTFFKIHFSKCQLVLDTISAVLYQANTRHLLSINFIQAGNSNVYNNIY